MPPLYEYPRQGEQWSRSWRARPIERRKEYQVDSSERLASVNCRHCRQGVDLGSAHRHRLPLAQDRNEISGARPHWDSSPRRSDSASSCKATDNTSRASVQHKKMNGLREGCISRNRGMVHAARWSRMFQRSFHSLLNCAVLRARTSLISLRRHRAPVSPKRSLTRCLQAPSAAPEPMGQPWAR